MNTIQTKPQITNLPECGADYSKINLQIADAVRTTNPSLSGLNLIEIWKKCMVVLKEMQLGLPIGDSAVLAMETAKKIWKDITPATDTNIIP
jgi:hypothetical protein